MNNSEKNKLMKSIMQVCFAMDDCKLFLDTHPNCPEALEYYEKLQNKRYKLMDDYNDKYGILFAYSADTEKGWNWNEGKMPWEGDD